MIEMITPTCAPPAILSHPLLLPAVLFPAGRSGRLLVFDGDDVGLVDDGRKSLKEVGDDIEGLVSTPGVLGAGVDGTVGDVVNGVEVVVASGPFLASMANCPSGR